MSAVVERCGEPGCEGASLVVFLRPGKEDYFVQKPKHSAFYSTTLEIPNSVHAARFELPMH